MNWELKVMVSREYVVLFNLESMLSCLIYEKVLEKGAKTENVKEKVDDLEERKSE